MLFELFSSARHSNTLKTGIVNNKRLSILPEWLGFWLYLFNYFSNLSRISFCISHMYNVLIRTGWILPGKNMSFQAIFVMQFIIVFFVFLKYLFEFVLLLKLTFLGSLCLHFRPLSTCQFIIKMIELNNCIILSHTLNSGGLFLTTSI